MSRLLPTPGSPTTPTTVNLAGEGAGQLRQLAVASDQWAFVAAQHRLFGRDADQRARANRFTFPFHGDPLRMSEHCGVLDQPGSRLAAQHAARFRGRLHPLSHPHRMPDDGVAAGTATNLSGDDFARVQTNPEKQFHVVSQSHFAGQLSGDRLDFQCGKTCAQRVILERDRGAEHCHQTVAGELVDRPLVPLNHRGRPVEDSTYDFAPSLGVQCGGQLHRSHDVREQDGDLLSLAGDSARTDG